MASFSPSASSTAHWVSTPPRPVWVPPQPLLRAPAADAELDRLRDERRGFTVTSYTRMKAKARS